MINLIGKYFNYNNKTIKIIDINHINITYIQYNDDEDEIKTIPIDYFQTIKHTLKEI